MDDSGEFSEEDFEACFKEFDKDGSGTIEKHEMAIFIKKVAGLDDGFGATKWTINVKTTYTCFRNIRQNGWLH